MLKLLMPSWRLFDRKGNQCRLYYRKVGKDISSPWIRLKRTPADRKLRQLFINPEDSSWLFFLSIVDECCYEICKSTEYDILTSNGFEFIKYFLNKNYVQSDTTPTPVQLRFEIFSETGENTSEYISRVFTCS